MNEDLLSKVDRGDFQEVFIEHLNWLAPDVNQSVTVTDDDGRKVSASNIASYKGLRVWLCDERPGSTLEAELDRLTAKTSTDRLVIFDGDKEQVWRWPVRRAKDGSVTSRLTSHRRRKGEVDPKFAARLDIIRMPFDVVLDANAVLGRVREAFDTEAQNESKRASKLMANMYAAVEKAYPQTVDPRVRDHEISVTLARILFLMFGDDTEMWQTDAFRNVIQHEVFPDGSNLARVLNDLFEYLDTPAPTHVPVGFAGFKHVNGGIFEERIALPSLDKSSRSAILDACAIDWSGISPAIFGSMFQSVRDADTRRALGEHYTSEENILKTLNPLFLDELRGELAEALARESTLKKVNSLNKLWERLGAIRFMDPACGCGNFIIVAYRELRGVELQLMEALYDLRDKHQLSLDAKSDLKVTLDHFYGIELDEWPARIAETAMFMIDRQCDLKLQERFGQAPERLPIQSEAKILVGNALRIDWNDLVPVAQETYIAGNPPFTGARRRTAEQTEDLKVVWGAVPSGDFDYVTGWHRRAAEFLADRQGRFALVSTNSVCQGQVVPPVFSWLRDHGWSIAFAHRTFRWASEAPGEAKVHCVIVGLTRELKSKRTLFSYPDVDGQPVEAIVAGINAYLIDGPQVLVPESRIRLSPQLPSCDFGSMANDGRGRSGLIVSDEDVAVVRRDPIARKYLRPFIQARELISGDQLWCLWLEDATAHDLDSSPVLRDRVARVRQHRLSSKRPATNKLAAQSQLFGERRQPASSYLGIPRHFSAKRPYFTAARYPAEVICGDANFTAADPDGLLFAVISSSMFMAWQRLVGGAIKSDPRFSKEVSWNTFPMPQMSARAREHVVEGGRMVLDARAIEPDWSLERHYPDSGMEPSLVAAHLALDERVDEAFGATGSLDSEVARQRLLLQHYESFETRRGRSN